ncbi:Golgin candidate 6 [Diplonema papillatum]|nr:Golgin candidate 6 [Diplonema papillatum]
MWGFSTQTKAKEREISPDQLIPLLISRVKNSTNASDKREAVRELQRLGERQLSQYVTKEQLTALANALRLNKDDPETAEGIVLTISDLVDEDASNRQSYLQALANAESSIRGIDTLLSVLSSHGFHARYSAMKILTALVEFHSELVPRFAFASNGLHNLVSILNDNENNGILRNEGLLLMKSIAIGDPEVQKIVVYENVFDSLLKIIREEGGIHGGILVEDCLEIFHHLLATNVSNQKYYRDFTGMNSLRPLLTLPEGKLDDSGQKIVVLAMCLVSYFLKPNRDRSEGEVAKTINSITGIVVKRIRRSDGTFETIEEMPVAPKNTLLGVIADLSIHPSPNVESQVEALRCLTMLVAGRDSVKSRVVTFVAERPSGLYKWLDVVTAFVTDGDIQRQHSASELLNALFDGGESASHVATGLAADSAASAVAATHPAHSLIRGIVDNASPAASPGHTGPPKLHGSNGLNGAANGVAEAGGPLQDEGMSRAPRLLTAAHCAYLLSMLLAHASPQALNPGLSQSTHEGVPTFAVLLACLRNVVRQGSDLVASNGLFRLVLHWARQDPQAALLFVADKANIPFFAETANAEGIEPVGTQVLSTLLIGQLYLTLLHEDNPGSEVGLARRNLRDALVRRIGTERLISWYTTLAKDPAYSSASPFFSTSTLQPWDSGLVAITTQIYDEIIVALHSECPPLQPPAPAALTNGHSNDSLHELLQKQEAEIVQLRAELQDRKLSAPPDGHRPNNLCADSCSGDENVALQTALKTQGQLEKQLSYIESELKSKDEVIHEKSEKIRLLEDDNQLLLQSVTNMEERSSKLALLQQLAFDVPELKSALEAAGAMRYLEPGSEPTTPCHVGNSSQVLPEEKVEHSHVSLEEYEALFAKVQQMEADQDDLFVLLGEYDERLRQLNSDPAPG